MDKVYTMEDFKKATEREQRKAKIKYKISEAAKWVDRNKEIILVVVPATMTAVTTGVKVAGRHRNLKKEEDLKDLYCYDRSLGHYWKLKRKLSNSEWLEIDKRKNNGERLSDILDEMKVLK